MRPENSGGAARALAASLLWAVGSGAVGSGALGFGAVGLGAVGLVALGLGGCSLTDGFSLRPGAKPVVPAGPPSEIAVISPVLEMMSALPQGDPAHQAEVFQATKDAAQLTPTTSNRLKYALALATPGHSGSDPVAAQRQLAELLASPQTLQPVERLLALIELRQVESVLVLQAENTRLRTEEPRDYRDKLAVINRRLATESDENAHLRKALDEARAKLEAVTHIERSINDRGSAVAPPKPKPAPTPTPTP